MWLQSTVRGLIPFNRFVFISNNHRIYLHNVTAHKHTAGWIGFPVRSHRHHAYIHMRLWIRNIEGKKKFLCATIWKQQTQFIYSQNFITFILSPSLHSFSFSVHLSLHRTIHSYDKMHGNVWHHWMCAFLTLFMYLCVMAYPNKYYFMIFPFRFSFSTAFRALSQHKIRYGQLH